MALSIEQIVLLREHQIVAGASDVLGATELSNSVRRKGEDSSRKAPEMVAGLGFTEVGFHKPLQLSPAKKTAGEDLERKLRLCVLCGRSQRPLRFKISSSRMLPQSLRT
jgi:hypothetical protein